MTTTDNNSDDQITPEIPLYLIKNIIQLVYNENNSNISQTNRHLKYKWIISLSLVSKHILGIVKVLNQRFTLHSDNIESFVEYLEKRQYESSLSLLGGITHLTIKEKNRNTVLDRIKTVLPQLKEIWERSNSSLQYLDCNFTALNYLRTEGKITKPFHHLTILSDPASIGQSWNQFRELEVQSLTIFTPHILMVAIMQSSTSSFFNNINSLGSNLRRLELSGLDGKEMTNSTGSSVDDFITFAKTNKNLKALKFTLLSRYSHESKGYHLEFLNTLFSDQCSVEELTVSTYHWDLPELDYKRSLSNPIKSLTLHIHVRDNKLPDIGSVATSFNNIERIKLQVNENCVSNFSIYEKLVASFISKNTESRYIEFGPISFSEDKPPRLNLYKDIKTVKNIVKSLESNKSLKHFDIDDEWKENNIELVNPLLEYIKNR